MEPIMLLSAPGSAALQHACTLLRQEGFPCCDTPAKHVTHLLLPVPCLYTDEDITELLAPLPKQITVIGGNLHQRALNGYRTLDLLQDPLYLAMNARITAQCALSVATQQLPYTFDDTEVLVIGWGRIGKCLGQLLKAVGSTVTVAARKTQDRAALASLGYASIDIGQIDTEKYGLILNTAPEPVLPCCPGNAVKIDLASRPGIPGEDVIHARGLPGKLAPHSSGKLIAQRISAYLKGKEVTV